MRAWSIAIITIIAGLSGCASIEDFDTAPAPAWEAGYAYSYDVEGDVSVSGYFEVDGERDDIPEETVTIERQPMMAYQALGTQLAIDDEPVYAVGALGQSLIVDPMDDNIRSIDVNGFSIRQRDLMVGMLDGLRDCAECTSSAQDIYLDFPLTPGKEWSSVDQEEDEVRVTVRSQAVGIDDLQLLDATVPAIRVVHDFDFALTDEGRREMREEMGGDAEIEGDGTITTWYSPAIQNIVKETTLMDLSMRINGEEGGTKYSMRFDFGMDVTTIITGADLTPMAERNAAAIAEFLANDGHIKDPSGAISAPLGDYSLVLNASDDRVNAAEAPSVDFETGVVGELPAGHELIYAHIHPDGSRTEGDGGSFSLDFTEPGIHTILAQSFEGDVMQARASTQVVADYTGLIEVDCPIVGAMQACEAATLPVGAGWDSITIRAESERLAPLPTTGTLLIEDAYGNSAEATGSTATIEDPALIADGREWTLQWIPQVSAMDTGVFDIDITYPDDSMETVQSADASLTSRLPHGQFIQSALDEMGVTLPL